MPEFGDDPLAAIKWAIQNRQSVNFRYIDKWRKPNEPGAKGPRVGNPHALWVGRNGTLYLHMWIDPQSASASASDGFRPQARLAHVHREPHRMTLQSATRGSASGLPPETPSPSHPVGIRPGTAQVGQPVAIVKRTIYP
jgi:hypothetical protein